jgi:hypothetical protein
VADSAKAFPTVLSVVDSYNSNGANQVSLLVHMISLPFHANAWKANQILHGLALAKGPDSQEIFDWLAVVYKNLDEFSGEATDALSSPQIRAQFVALAFNHSDIVDVGVVQNSFFNSSAEQAARDFWRIGVLREVYGTPSFFLNGDKVTDASSTTTADEWRTFIDPLLGQTQ